MAVSLLDTMLDEMTKQKNTAPDPEVVLVLVATAREMRDNGTLEGLTDWWRDATYEQQFGLTLFALVTLVALAEPQYLRVNRRHPDGAPGTNRAVRPMAGELTATSGRDTEPRETLMASRLFSLTPNEAIKLMQAWGWVCEGPVPGHGTQSLWRWRDDGRGVQLPNRGIKKHQRAIQSAFDKAWRVMGLDSMQEFLAGPPERQVDQPELVDGMDPVALRRAERLAERHGAAGEKEQTMSDPRIGQMTKMGTRTGLADTIMRAAPVLPQPWHYKDMARHLEAVGTPFAERLVAASVAHLAQRAKYPKLERVSRGTYRYVAKEPVAKAPETETPAVTTPPELSHSDATAVAERQKVYERELGIGSVLAEKPQPAVATATVVSNGSTPDLLSKVAVLDGGSLLFQGDDGSLYVVSKLVKLALPS